jgi:hypothetical protein
MCADACVRRWRLILWDRSTVVQCSEAFTFPDFYPVMTFGQVHHSPLTTRADWAREYATWTFRLVHAVYRRDRADTPASLSKESPRTGFFPIANIRQERQ